MSIPIFRKNVYNIDMELKQLSPVTLQKQLHDEILTSIENGTYRPGARIPTEFELADMYGVSRVTVRGAIQQLANEGKIIKKHGKGTFVKEKVHKEGIYSGFGFTENCLKRGVVPSTDIIECKLGLCPEEIGKELGTHSEQIIIIKRVRKVDGEPCIFEIDYIPGQFDFLLSNKLSDTSILKTIEEKTGIIPASFIDQFSISFSNRELSEHLNCPIRTPLLEVFQSVRTKDDRIIYINRQYILTSKYIYIKK